MSMDPRRPSDFQRDNHNHQLRRLRQARTWLLVFGSIVALVGVLVGIKAVILAGVGPIVLGLLAGLAVRVHRANTEIARIVRDETGGPE